MAYYYSNLAPQKPLLGRQVEKINKTILPTIMQGRSITLVQIQSNRIYKYLSSGSFGKRSGNVSRAVTHLAHARIAVDEPRILSGISTVGVGYQPQVNTVVPKEIRRWPRDWHGDNMKK